MIALIIGSIDDPNERKFFSELYVTHRRLMVSTAKKYASRREDQEDIVQSAMERLLKKFSVLQPMGRCTLAAYIVYTVKSTAIDFLRKEQATTANVISLDDAKPEEIEAAGIPATDHESLLEIQESLNTLWPQLPEEDQVLLEGKYIWEKPDKELAEILHCKPNSIRMKLTRARRRALDNLRGKEQV